MSVHKTQTQVVATFCCFLVAHITLPVTSRVFSKLCVNTYACEEEGYPLSFLDTHFVYSYTGQEVIIKFHSWFSNYVRE